MGVCGKVRWYRGRCLCVGHKPHGVGCVGRTWWPGVVYKVKRVGAQRSQQQPPARQRSEACGKRCTHPGNVGFTDCPNPTSEPRATSRVNPSAAAKRNRGRRWWKLNRSLGMTDRKSAGSRDTRHPCVQVRTKAVFSLESEGFLFDKTKRNLSGLRHYLMPPPHVRRRATTRRTEDGAPYEARYGYVVT